MSNREDLIDADGVTTPLCRAQILASVLRRVSVSLQPIDVQTLWRSVLEEMGLTEEEGSGDFITSVFLLSHSGLIDDGRFDANGMRIRIGMGDVLRPSRLITGFIWEDEVADSNSESSNGRL